MRFQGRGAKFEQPISKMQFYHKPITSGKKGQEIAVKVVQKVKEGLSVYLVGQHNQKQQSFQFCKQSSQQKFCLLFNPVLIC